MSGNIEDAIDRVTDRIDGASAILLLAPPGTGDDEACVALSSLGDPHGRNILSVTFAASAEDRLDVFESPGGEALPPDTCIISVGETVRSAAADGSGSVAPPGGPSVETLSHPDGLVELGMKTAEYLSAWEDNGNRTVGCFHSITDLLGHVGTPEAFRFLHVIIGRLRAADAVAHFHMDPGAHDPETIRTFEELFDAVVDLRSGEPTVRPPSSASASPAARGDRVESVGFPLSGPLVGDRARAIRERGEALLTVLWSGLGAGLLLGAVLLSFYDEYELAVLSAILAVMNLLVLGRRIGARVDRAAPERPDRDA